MQFVVLTLIAAMPMARGTAQAGAAFSTPNVVHFGAVLLLAGILSAPWKDISFAAVVWGLLGLSGIVYEIIVARRMRVQSVYKPVFEDWLFHVVLPLAAYATLAVMAFAAGQHLRGALFGIGAAAMLLLFVASTMRGMRLRIMCLKARRKFSREFTRILFLSRAAREIPTLPSGYRKVIAKAVSSQWLKPSSFLT
ncbi:MAG TPA: hypothetical protein VGK01_21910 [Candidatus Angelobacter sp.]